MKEIYLCETKENIKRIYQVDAPVFNREALLAEPGKFRDVEVIFSTWGMPYLTEAQIRENLPELKAVFYAAGTVQAFARPFLAQGVRVFSAWAANAVPVAEYTVAQILLANKGFFRTMGYTDKKAAFALAETYPGNFHSRVGIIGAGMIGKLVIKLLKNFNLEVVVFDPFLPEETARELGVEKVSLEEIFTSCRVVSNHLANNDQTKGMLHGGLFSKMLPYATFLNTGRGAQVVEGELIACLQQRPDLTAILDVTSPEPPVAGSPLYTLPNCILTPHIAGSTGNEVRRMGQYMKEEFARFAAGQPCRYEVTEKMLATMA